MICVREAALQPPDPLPQEMPPTTLLQGWGGTGVKKESWLSLGWPLSPSAHDSGLPILHSWPNCGWKSRGRNCEMIHTLTTAPGCKMPSGFGRGTEKLNPGGRKPASGEAGNGWISLLPFSWARKTPDIKFYTTMTWNNHRAHTTDQACSQNLYLY